VKATHPRLHRIETGAEPEAVWRLWADVAGWLEWNGDIEHIELRGPLSAGSTIVMRPFGGHPVELRIAEAVANRRFVDEASLTRPTPVRAGSA